MRQRIHVGSSWRTTLGKLVTAVVALGVAWFGLALLLVALGVAPGDVDSVLGYRSAYDAVHDLDGADASQTLRIVLAVGMAVLCVVLLVLAWAQLPRPALARRDVELGPEGDADADAAPHGRTTVNARAVERAAELGALSVEGVSAARARLDADEVVVALRSERAEGLADQLRAARAAADAALSDSGFPALDARVVLAGFDNDKDRR